MELLCLGVSLGLYAVGGERAVVVFGQTLSVAQREGHGEPDAKRVQRVNMPIVAQLEHVVFLVSCARDRWIGGCWWG